MNERTKSRRLRGAIAAALVGAAVTGLGVNALAGGAPPVPVAAPVSAAIPASFAELAARVRPSVVYISTEAVVPAGPAVGGLPPGAFAELFGQRPEQRVNGVGSGFVVDPSGVVVTNYHVIKDAEHVQVTLNDGTTLPAEVVGSDPKTDLAVLRVHAKHDLPAVRFGDSDATRVGDWVVAVGNPFGLGGSVSAGIVSARGRDIHSGPYDDYLQFDAPINRGNSGGPLFNTRGEVVGVNSAIFSPSGGNVGIGFAVPASTAAPVVAQLETSGRVDRGWVGVQVQELTPELAASLGLDDAHGALVVSVVPGSPAAAAGLERGDVVLAVDGKPVGGVHDAVRAIGAHHAGAKLAFEVWRDGARRQVLATLAEPPSAPMAAADESQAPSAAKGRLGVRLSELTDQERQRWRIADDTSGALIVAVAPGGPAARSELRPGDVIVMVGRAEIHHPQEVGAALRGARANPERPVLLLVERQGAQRYVAVDVG